MNLYQLRPEFVERPWGRSSLVPLYAAHSPSVDKPVGEVWLTSLDCRIAPVTGKSNAGAEQSLRQFWLDLSAQERGSTFGEVERFPLLVKVLFTSEPLSVQVHPGDEYARREEGEPWGKSEAWHVLAAESDAWVEVGLQAGVTDDGLASAWGEPELVAMLNRIPVGNGDTVYVPAGTVHSIGPGLCLVEVQQYSDVTYRIYDHGRNRELHSEKAKAVTKLLTPEAGLVSAEPRHDKEGSVDSVRVVSSPYFVVDKGAIPQSAEVELQAADESITIYLVTSGGGKVVCDDDEVDCRAGDCFLVPAGDGSTKWKFDVPGELLRVRPVMPSRDT